MGLVRGFVLSLNRRGLLAILAIAVSVGYALVAGATLTGLEDAQDTLAGDLQDPGHVVARPSFEGFNLDAFPAQPNTALAVTDEAGYTFYTLRAGADEGALDAEAVAAPATQLPPGDAELTVGEHELTVTRGEPQPGARSDWIRVNETTFEQLGGPSPPTVHVAHVTGLAEDERSRLEAQGYETHQAPAALGFYVAGTDELVTSIAVTVASSALVVALLATGFVNMELRAKRQTLATLKLYAGAGKVRQVIAGRGLVLLAAGHVLALAVTFGLTALLSSASRLDVALEPGFAAASASATFLGGALGLLGPLRRAGERVEAGELAEREPPSWLPAWLRPSLASWRLLVPLVAAAVILSASLGIVFGMVDLPTQLFGQGGGQVIADASANPLRGSVDPFPGFHLGGVDGYDGASPEIFAPTTVQGKAVMTRGVSWPHLDQMEDLDLRQGRALQSEDEAVVGHRLAARLDVTVGDTLTLPSAYTASLTHVEVVGVAEGGGLLGDEVLVPLATARGMTQLEAGQVNMVRFAPSSQAPPEGLPEGIEATGLSLTPSQPVPHEEVTVGVDLVNFAEETDTRRLTLRVNGEPVDDAWPTLPARSTGTAEMSFTVPAKGIEQVAVNPEAHPSAGDPAYEIEAPAVATVENGLEVTVRDTDGDPVPDVEVRIGDHANVTDADGETSLDGLSPGNETLFASGSEGRAARSIVLVEQANLHRPHLVLREIDGPEQVRPGQRWEGVAEFVNLGGEAYDGRPTIQVDNGTETLPRIRLLSGQWTRVPVELALDPGAHRVGTNETFATVEVTHRTPTGESGAKEGTGNETAPNATLEQLLDQRRERAQSSSAAGQSATQAFLGDTFENLNAALTLIVTATILHAGLVTFVAVFRQVAECSANLGTLSAIGASEGAVRGRALREYATVGLPAALVGTLAGLALAVGLTRLDLLTGFGHALTPRTDVGFVLRVTLAALATTVVAALLAVQASDDRGAANLMDEGPVRSQRPPLTTLTGASSE